MSDGSSWKKTLKRTRDSLKRKFRRSREFLSILRAVGDERRGFNLSRERRRPESAETSEEMLYSGEVQSEVPNETEMDGGQNSEESPARSHHQTREPLENDGAPTEDFPPPVEEWTRPEESRVSTPLPKGTTTTNVNESSSRETLSEGSHTSEVPASERMPDKKACANRFLSNDPLAGESSTRQPLSGRSLARESEVEGSLPGERSSTMRPDVEPLTGGSSSAPNTFASNTFAPNTFAPHFFAPNFSDPNTSEEPEDVESIEQSEYLEDVEQFEHDEDVEWFEHIEYADQDLYTSLPADESTTNNGNSLTTSTSTSPDPTMRRPRRPQATAENNRLLRLPLEIRLMIYDELLAIPRTISLLHPKKERNPLHSIRKVDKELFTRRARLRFKYSAPIIGHYDPRTTTFAARFTDDDNCTHRQWGSEHLGAITNFAPRPPPPMPPLHQHQHQHQPRATGPTIPPPPTNRSRPRGSALLYGICSPAAKRANLLTWHAIHARLVERAAPPPPCRAIRVLELEFPRICSAINVLKSLVLGRVQGWRELRRLSVLRIRVRAGGGGGDGGEGEGGSGGGGGGGGPLNEVDMVALYSLALTLSEEMERKVLLRRGPRIEIAW